MLGKLEAPETLLMDIESAGLKSVAFTMRHADAMRIFPNLSKHDSFDRMLLAQAQADGMSFLTSDRFLIDQNIGFLLDARK